MPWNLVDNLSGSTSPRRAFYPPLASIAPGNTTVSAVFPSAFTASEAILPTGETVLNIRIERPFTPEVTPVGTLPDPALRLHAVAPGLLRFQPQDATMGDRLILETPMFLTSLDVPWWQRWVEADCLPYEIIYENVDRSQLETWLRSIPLLTDPTPAFHGLSLPRQVSLPTHLEPFIQSFLQGLPGHQLTVESGAIIGTAAADPVGGTGRLLKLHGRYYGHTDTNPHFMNPREFLNLLFGNDSDEFRQHPLLMAIDGGGLLQSGFESKTMRLRPPLRTHARVIWESDIEVLSHPADWSEAGSCGDRFYNNHIRQGRQFNHGNYTGFPKCNLFISDIALRSGFRCCIHQVGTNRWHYNAAGRYTDNVQRVGAGANRIPLQGQIDHTPMTWGFKFEGEVRALGGGARIPHVNNLMHVEGRCLVLAGSRAVGPGHIVLVKSVGGILDLVGHAGDGISRIEVTTREARLGDTHFRIGTFRLHGTGGPADGLGTFTRLHLFELYPARDPDTPLGLLNCNVEA